MACGNEFPDPFSADEVSTKSFAVAVSLCGVFGLAGIHHFYLGNILHGIFDLGLLIVGLVLISSADGSLATIGGLLLFIDFLHTIFVMYYLFTGKTKDGAGRLVVYPGQL